MSKREYLEREEKRVKKILKRPELTEAQRKSAERELATIQHSAGKTKEAEATEARRQTTVYVGGQPYSVAPEQQEKFKEEMKKTEAPSVEKKLKEAGFYPEEVFKVPKKQVITRPQIKTKIPPTEARRLGLISKQEYEKYKGQPVYYEVSGKEARLAKELKAKYQWVKVPPEKRPVEVYQRMAEYDYYKAMEKMPGKFKYPGEVERIQKLTKPVAEREEAMFETLGLGIKGAKEVPTEKIYPRTVVGATVPFFGLTKTGIVLGGMGETLLRRPKQFLEIMGKGWEKMKESIIGLPQYIKEKPRRFAGYVAGMLTPVAVYAGVKGVQHVQWKRAKAETAFKEVITEPSKEIKESIGIAKTRFKGKTYPSVFKSRYIVEPGEISRGKGITGIITKVGKERVKTIAGTEFVTKDFGDVSSQISLSKYVSQAGIKTIGGMEAGKYLIKKVQPDFFATVGETLTGKKIPGVVGGITRIQKPSLAGFTFYPPTKTIGVTPGISKLIGETVKQTIKPSLKPSPLITVAGVTTISVPSFEGKKLGIKVKKVRQIPKKQVMRKEAQLTRQEIKTLTSQSIKQAQDQLSKRTQEAMRTGREVPTITASVSREVQKPIPMQRVGQLMALQQKTIQGTIGMGIPTPIQRPPHKITPPTFKFDLELKPMKGRKVKAPIGYRYWLREWPFSVEALLGIKKKKKR